jgi:hypothetical protein
MRGVSQSSREHAATKAARRRVHEGRDKLPGPSNTALIHCTDIIARYISGIVTGACRFSVHRVLRPPSAHSACWPLLHAWEWVELGARPAGGAATALSTISITCWWRAKWAMCTYSLRSRVRRRPQGQAYLPPCTRGGFLRVSCPAAHVQLAYLDALTCSHHRSSSVCSPACTNQSSHHGGRRA